MEVPAGILLAVNVLGLALMGYDKARAQAGRYRVPEKSLLLTAACGGAAGVWLGMRLFRHKTLHTRFSLGVPVLFALQAGLIWLWYGAQHAKF